MYRIVSLCICCLSLLVFLVSGASAEKVLRVGIGKEPTTLNPLFMEGIFAESIAGNIFDTLVGSKDSMAEVEPLLAKRWKISDDGKTYTFFLRKGVLFHNGQELTSRDVKFTLDLTLDENTASPNRQFLQSIKKIETPDPYTVVFTLSTPHAPLLLALANPSVGILSASHVTKVGLDGLSHNPIGTGPFSFVEMVAGKHILLKKNPAYFIAEPNLDAVVFLPIVQQSRMARELEAGRIDLATEIFPQDVPRLVNQGFVAQSVPGLLLRYLGFSAQMMPFNDVRFRKAVYHAISFDSILPQVFNGLVKRAYSWIPEGLIGDDLEYMTAKALPFDVVKAKRLLAELKAEGIFHEGLSFNIYTSGEEFTAVAEDIRAQLEKIGINSNVVSLDWVAFFPLLKAGKCGMFIMGWGSVPDPHRWTYRPFVPDSSMNFSRYENDLVTRYLKAGARSSDPVERGALYRKAMRKALGEDYIHIPLVWVKTLTVASPRLIGFTPSPQKYVHLVTWGRNVDLH